MLRCCAAPRSSVFVALGFAALITVGAAGCRGDGDGPDALEPVTPSSGPTVVVVGDGTPTTAPTTPSATTDPDAASPADTVDLDALDSAIGTELDEVLDALDQYDQMTATTEGDPSR